MLLVIYNENDGTLGGECTTSLDNEVLMFDDRSISYCMIRLALSCIARINNTIDLSLFALYYFWVLTIS